MNWNRTECSLRSSVRIDERTVLATIYESVNGKGYVCLVWELGKETKKFCSTDLFLLIGKAEEEIDSLCHEIKSQSAMWQEA